MKKYLLLIIGCALLIGITGCQTSYYKAEKGFATLGKDGKWRGSVQKEGVPDWSPGKALNLSGLKAGL